MTKNTKIAIQFLTSILILTFSYEVRAQVEPLPEKKEDSSEQTQESASASVEEKPAAKKKRKIKKIEVPEEKKPAEKDSTVLSADDVFKSLEYPELQVVPRATDRLQYEAQYESDKKYLVHWPLALPALATLYLGISADGEYKEGATDSEKDSADLYAQGATVIGGFWLAATGFISWMKPYRSGYARVRKNKDTDKRGELFRERIAEETLENQANVMKTLVKLSVASSFLITAALASETDVDAAQLGITALLAFTPWAFEHRHVSVWNKHLEYKRKIYTPVSSINFRRDEISRQFHPIVGLKWYF